MQPNILPCVINLVPSFCNLTLHLNVNRNCQIDRNKYKDKERQENIEMCLYQI